MVAALWIAFNVRRLHIPQNVLSCNSEYHKCARKTAYYTLFRSKMWKEVAQQTCVSLCPSPDVEKAPLHPLVALFCPSLPPDVADHTDAEELPVLVSIQLFPPTISGWSTILVSLLFISTTLLCDWGQPDIHNWTTNMNRQRQICVRYTIYITTETPWLGSQSQRHSS